MAQIGFVGLGHMGLPMAQQLVLQGHHVTGFDIQESALRAFEEMGGHRSNKLLEVSQNKAFIITMLQTGEQVLDVCLKQDGLFANAHQDALFIDCSSIDVESARTYHLRAQEQGLKAIEAPVSGGVAGAKEARLTFMVGGDTAEVERAKPILSLMGKKIIHTGGAGSGQAAKICNNMILGISMIAISEAFILAEALGLEAAKLFEVVNNASGQCWAMSQYVPVPGILPNVPANQHYEPGFTSAMMLKDLKLSQTSAQQGRVHTPLGEQALKLYQQFNQDGHGGLDFSAIITALSEQQKKL